MDAAYHKDMANMNYDLSDTLSHMDQKLKDLNRNIKHKNNKVST